MGKGDIGLNCQNQTTRLPKTEYLYFNKIGAVFMKICSFQIHMNNDATFLMNEVFPGNVCSQRSFNTYIVTVEIELLCELFEINMRSYLIHLTHFSATYIQLGFCVVMGTTLHHYRYHYFI